MDFVFITMQCWILMANFPGDHAQVSYFDRCLHLLQQGTLLLSESQQDLISESKKYDTQLGCSPHNCTLAAHRTDSKLDSMRRLLMSTTYNVAIKFISPAREVNQFVLICLPKHA